MFPVWYRKRFIAPTSEDRSLFYLDLAPVPFVDANAGRHLPNNPRFIGPKKCFFEEDLYAVFMPGIEDTALEIRNTQGLMIRRCGSMEVKRSTLCRRRGFSC